MDEAVVMETATTVPGKRGATSLAPKMKAMVKRERRVVGRWIESMRSQNSRSWEKKPWASIRVPVMSPSCEARITKAIPWATSMALTAKAAKRSRGTHRRR